MLMMSRLVLASFVSSSLLMTSFAQRSKQHILAEKVFTNRRELPQLNSFFHWNYDKATGKLDIAFTHAGITSANTWVAWAINSNNDLYSSMLGAQTLVAIPHSNGVTKVYTSSITDYDHTVLGEGNISYPHSVLKATYEYNKVTIFATLTLPYGTNSIVHLWQDGPLYGSIPQPHVLDSPNLSSKEILNLVTGSTL